MAAEFRKKLCVRGYHVYDIWEAAVWEALVCIREPRNTHDTCDRYAAEGGNYSWWQNFSGFNFCDWGDPRKFQHNENVCIYGTCRDNADMLCNTLSPPLQSGCTLPHVAPIIFTGVVLNPKHSCAWLLHCTRHACILEYSIIIWLNCSLSYVLSQNPLPHNCQVLVSLPSSHPRC